MSELCSPSSSWTRSATCALALFYISLLATPTPALGQRTGSPQVEQLLAQITDPALDDDARLDAGTALGALGEEARVAVPALIEALSHSDGGVRFSSAWAIGRIGPRADEAIPALAGALDDQDQRVRMAATMALWKFGPRAAPAVPSLVRALKREGRRAETRKALVRIGAPAIPALADATWDEEIRDDDAAFVLMRIGSRLKEEGEILYWVVPRVYWKHLTGLALLHVAWLALMARFPRHRPSRTPKHLALMVLTAAVPVALACSAVHYAITREWAQGFLPDAVTVVPFPVAAVLSVALVCVLPAIWVCQRKTVATEAVDDPTPPVEPDPAPNP